MSTALRSPLVEDVARAIYSNRAAYRHAHGLVARSWPNLSEVSKEHYRSMANAALAGMRGHTLTFAPLNLRERIKAGWKRFLERHWACEYTGPGEL